MEVVRDSSGVSGRLNFRSVSVDGIFDRNIRGLSNCWTACSSLVLIVGMFNQLRATSGFAPLRLSNILFGAPLSVTSDTSVRLQLGNDGEIHIASGEPVLCSGKVESCFAEHLHLDAVDEHDFWHIAPHDLYHECQAVGDMVGRSWRTIEDFQMNSNRARGVVRAAVREDADHLPMFFPEILEGAILVASSFLAGGMHTVLRIPSKMRSASFYLPVERGRRYVVDVVRTSNGVNDECRVMIGDEQGVVVGILEGFEFRSAAEMEFGDIQRPRDCLLHLDWVRIKVAQSTLSESKFLLIRDAIAQEGGHFDTKDITYATPSFDMELEKFDHVVFWVDANASSPMVPMKAATRLLQKAIQEKYSGRVWIVTEGVWDDDRMSDGSYAASVVSGVWGLSRSARMEHPKLSLSLVDAGNQMGDDFILERVCFLATSKSCSVSSEWRLVGDDFLVPELRHLQEHVWEPTRIDYTGQSKFQVVYPPGIGQVKLRVLSTCIPGIKDTAAPVAVAGVVAALGEGVERWCVGDIVCTLCNSGAVETFVVANGEAVLELKNASHERAVSTLFRMRNSIGAAAASEL